MAISLIEQLTPKKFTLENYKDTYDQELMKIIEMKAKGTKIPKSDLKVVHSKSKDLMAMLKASLDQTEEKKSVPKKKVG